MLCIAQQNLSIGVNVVSDGSPSRILRVLLISLGVTILMVPFIPEAAVMIHLWDFPCMLHHGQHHEISLAIPGCSFITGFCFGLIKHTVYRQSSEACRV